MYEERCVMQFISRFMWITIRPDAAAAPENPIFKKALSWYFSVMNDRKPAKFLIAKRIQSPENPAKLDEESLWDLHKELSKEFESLLREVRKEDISLSTFMAKFHEFSPSFLDVKIELTKRILSRCRFCERSCKVDRASGEKGFCRLDTTTYVHSWFHHLGEEAPLVPSGTIFYGSCNFRCVFCQNWDISQENYTAGVEVTPKSLALMQRELRIRGARNINHVGGDPTPNIHTIIESLKYLDINVPQLWNSNFYMSKEAMEILIHVIDIWLPDFKYGNDKCAIKLSSAPKYFEVVTRNLLIAIEHGDMIIRHLVLPNHIECCTKPILKWIANNLPKDRVLVNIMDQYRPEYLVARYPSKFKDISRRLKYNELKEAFTYAERLKILFEDISR